MPHKAIIFSFLFHEIDLNAFGIYFGTLLQGVSLCWLSVVDKFNKHSHTLDGSETPHCVSLSKIVFSAVCLVKFEHMLGENILIQVVRKRV